MAELMQRRGDFSGFQVAGALFRNISLPMLQQSNRLRLASGCAFCYRVQVTSIACRISFAKSRCVKFRGCVRGTKSTLSRCGDRISGRKICPIDQENRTDVFDTTGSSGQACRPFDGHDRDNSDRTPSGFHPGGKSLKHIRMQRSMTGYTGIADLLLLFVCSLRQLNANA